MIDSRTYRGAEVLVTGGIGFIGSNLVRQLVHLGASVTILDAMIPGHGGNWFNLDGLENLVRLNLSDMRDVNTLNHLVREKKYIFNLAGQVSHTDSMRDPAFDLAINVQSHVCLLEACRSVNPEVKIVFASTRQVYGRPHTLPVDESHIIQPVDVNGINKYSCECYHALYHSVYGIPTCILRLTNCYGPRQLISHARQGFVGWFVRQLLVGEEIQIFGDGNQIRDFNYVDDVCDAFLMAAANESSNGRVYNLGSDTPMSIRDLVELMVLVNGGGGYRIVPFPPERKQIDIGDYYGNYNQIQMELGWKPKTTIKDGLTRMFSFCKTHRTRYL